ncbi:MAG: hypothetical protein IJE05_02525, partial [Clostridia bacterium]|nr:hypothetical protein [Clostridia bacterium]
GAFQYDLNVDEDMNIIGNKSFLYISRINSYQKELIEIFGTDINLAHLIHELGHAWAAYFQEYELDENGGVHNTGFAKERFYIDKEKRKAIINQYDGLITEEAMNTIEEEDALLDLLQIDSIDELKKIGYVHSKYQGFVVMIMRMYVQQFGKLPFDMYRFLRDDTGLKQVESELENTEAWTEMQKEEFTIRKRRTFSRVDELEIKEQSRQIIKDFFSYYEKDFFPDNSKFTPMKKLENVLTQLYNMESIKWSFGIVGNEKCQEIYRTIMMSILTEASVMIRQVEKKKENSTDDSNDYRG